MVVFVAGTVTAQAQNCVTGTTLYSFDFGGYPGGPVVAGGPLPPGASALPFVSNPAGLLMDPGPGGYLLTKNIAGSKWRVPDIGDHTKMLDPAKAGYFMLVNSEGIKDVFYTQRIDNLCPGTVEKFTVSVLPLVDNGKAPTIKFAVLNALDNSELNSKLVPFFFTGQWSTQTVDFRLPANVSSVIIRMSTETPVGLGNDFGVDDIIISTCQGQFVSSVNGDAGSQVLVCPQSQTVITAAANTSPFDNLPFVLNPTYEWSFREDATKPWVTLPGETAATLTIPNISTFKTGVGGQFKYTVSSGSGGSAACKFESTPQTVKLTNFNMGISVTPASVPEGNALTYTVTANAPVIQPLDVAINFSGTANLTGDYTVTGLTALGAPGAYKITIPKGSTTGTFTVNTIKDDIIRPSRTVIATMVTQGSDPCVTGFTTASATGTITDVSVVDPTNPRLKITAVTPTVTEGPGVKAIYRIQFVNPTVTSAADLTLNYTMSGTAAAVVDYVKPSGTIVLPKDSNGVFLAVDIVDNNIIQLTRTLISTLSAVNQPFPGITFTIDNTPATVQILDDDSQPAFRVLRITKKADASEPATNGSFTVGLPAGKVSASDIPINYTIDPLSTAKPGQDYVAITQTFTLPAGSNSIDIPVVVIDNKIIDGTRTVIMKLNNTTAVNGLQFPPDNTAARATVNIIDDESVPGNLLVGIEAIRDAIEGGTNGEFRVFLPPGITASTAVTVAFAVSSGGNNAVPGVHYQAITSIVIPAGSNEVRVPVVAISENIINPPLTVELTLADSKDGVNNIYKPLPTAAKASLKRIDRFADPATRPLSIKKINDAKEPSTNGLFRVSLPAVSAEAVTVTFQVAGTAVAGVDYKKIITIVIPASSDGVDVPVEVIGNKIIQPTRTVDVTLLGGSSAAYTYIVSATEGKATVNISDDNGTNPANTIVKVTRGKDGAEPSTNGSFIVSLPAGYTATENLTLQYVLSGTAVLNRDYTIGQVVLPAGSNSVEVPVVVIDNKILDAIRTVVMQLSGVNQPIPGAVFTVNPTPDSIRILDNNISNKTEVILEAVPGEDVAKGPDGVARLRVRFVDPTIISASDITVSYQVGGTAVAPDRYETLSGTVVIPAGQKEAYILVKAVPSNIVRPVETVVVTLTKAVSVAGGFTLKASGQGTVRILDAFDQKELGITVVKVKDAAEPATNGLFRIKYAPNNQIAASEDVTISYSISGTAVSGTDYQPLSGSITIPKGSNGVDLPVIVIDNKVLDGTRTVILQLTNATQPIAGVTMKAAGSATMNITDDDSVNPANMVVKVTRGKDGAEPSTNGSFIVSLPAGYTTIGNLTLQYVLSGTAVLNRDYTIGQVVLPAGSNSVEVPVVVIDNKILDGIRTVVMKLSGVNQPLPGAVFTVSPTPDSIRILDNNASDKNAVILEAVPGEDVAKGPNGVARLRVRFADPGVISTSDITVSYQVGGTAVAPDRYETLSGTVVISAGQKEAYILVKAVPSNIVRPVETVVITLTKAVSVAGGFTLKASGQGTVRILDAFDQKELGITVVKVKDAAEPATNGLFRIKYAPNNQIAASEDVTISYSIGGTALSGTDYQPLSGSITIPKGSNGVDLPVIVIDNKVLDSTRTVILQLTNATQPIAGVTMKATGSATVNIIDDDLGPDPGAIEARKLCIRKIADGVEGGANGRFEIGFVDKALTSSRPIRVRFNIQGSTAFPVKDYEPVSPEDGVIVLPARQNSVQVNLKVIDDKIAKLPRQAVFNLESAESPFAGVELGIGGNGCASATINITDNDTLRVRIDRQQEQINEGETARFILRVLDDVTLGAPIQLKIAYRHDEDHTYTLDGNSLALEGTLNKMIKSTTETIDIVSIDNDIHDEQGFVGLKLLDGDVIAGTLPYKVVSAEWQDVLVNDNDPLEVKWVAKQVSKLEGNTLRYEPMGFAVTLNRLSSRDVRIRFRTQTDVSIRKIQRAIPASATTIPFLIDYDDAGADTVVIKKGSLSDTAFVPVMADTIYELDEHFIVGITDAALLRRNGEQEQVPVSQDKVTGVIVNDDTFDCGGDYDYDGIPNWKEAGYTSIEQCTGSGGPLDFPDTDDDGIPDYLDLDSDNDGVPDSVEGWIKDDRWRDDNKGLIRVHPGVSPNHDGKGNDCMYIENILKYQDNEVVVFNRWGDVVYKAKGYNNADVSFCGIGNYRGANNKEVTDGVYYYVVYLYNVDGKSGRYTGFIVIKR